MAERDPGVFMSYSAHEAAHRMLGHEPASAWFQTSAAVVERVQDGNRRASEVVSEYEMSRRGPAPAASPERLLTIGEFAEAVRFTEQTITRMIKRGQINAIKVLGRVRIPQSELTRLLRDSDSA